MTKPETAQSVDAPKVLAAMSGGVDSSVATALLIEQGFDVVGSMLRFWPDERPQGAFYVCCSPGAAYDARRMAAGYDVSVYLIVYCEMIYSSDYDTVARCYFS